MPESRGPHINHAYLIGSYLLVNAVPDLQILVDGPSCVFDKAGLVVGQHDLSSTALSCDGRHRFFHAGTDTVTIASTYEPRLVATLRRLAQEPGGALLVTALPMCLVAGTDYERLVAQVAPQAARPVLVLPARSLSHDWIGGYCAVLETLAAGLELKPMDPQPERVAVVGYLMDRNEGEHRGNLRELRRMLEALDLEPVCIWPSGAPLAELMQVQRAGTIIGLPMAGQAAHILADRLGARLVETEMPLGLPATQRWLLTVGRALGREQQAQAFIDQELGRIAPRLQWTLPKLFVQSRVVFQGAPCYAAPLAEQLEELGASLVGCFLTGTESALPVATLAELEARGTVLTDPLAEDLQTAWRALDPASVDLVIANTVGLDQLRPRGAWLEWGYPSNFMHHYRDEPFLGFEGALAFCGRMANELAAAPLRRALEHHHRGAAPSVPSAPGTAPGGSRCVLPWNSLHVGVDGTVRSCCLVLDPLQRPDGQPFRLGPDRLLDVWQSEALARFRGAFAAGERPQVCDRCWQVEAAGGHSKRLGALQVFPEAAGSVDADEPRLEALDLNLDNRCNLTCRTCNPEDSSAWAVEAEHQAQILGQGEPRASGVVDAGSWSRDPDVWEGIDKLLPQLRRVDLVGGEPMLIPAGFDFLQRCIDHGEADHIQLNYCTNGTVLPPRGAALWPQFAGVRIGVSVDAVGDRFEYLRHPAKWSKVLKTITALGALPFVELDCRVTASLYNVLYLPELHDWAVAAGLPYRVMPVTPSCFSVQVLPTPAKRAVRQQLQEHAITKDGVAAADVRALLDHMDARDGYAEHFEQLQRLTILGDEYRQESFERVFPELCELLDWRSLLSSMPPTTPPTTTDPDQNQQ